MFWIDVITYVSACACVLCSVVSLIPYIHVQCTPFLHQISLSH